jgi:hypothetical protein
MTDEPLTPDERQSMDRLAREIEPPAGLEDRVVSSLYASGHLRRPGRAWLGRVAAALVIFLAGYGAAWLPAAFAGRDSRPAYLLLLYGGATASAEAEAARVQEYAAWARAEAEAGDLVTGERLGASQIVLGPRAAGPADEAGPAGFFMIRAADAAAAAAIAARCPHLRHGGTVVVRAIE